MGTEKLQFSANMSMYLSFLEMVQDRPMGSSYYKTFRASHLHPKWFMSVLMTLAGCKEPFFQLRYMTC